MSDLVTRLRAVRFMLADPDPKDPVAMKDYQEILEVCELAADEIHDWESSFALYDSAVRRATHAWREANPERGLILPDTAKALVAFYETLQAEEALGEMGGEDEPRFSVCPRCGTGSLFECPVCRRGPSVAPVPEPQAHAERVATEQALHDLDALARRMLETFRAMRDSLAKAEVAEAALIALDEVEEVLP